jgi:predicted nucleotidyltransferase
MSIAELRKQKGLTQKGAAQLLGIPLRTFLNYEYGITSTDSFTGRALLRALQEYEPYDENHGILPMDLLIANAQGVLAKYSSKSIEYVYLFGSYAKGTPQEKSDVDLLLSGTITGLDFFVLQDELRKALHKKVDLLKLADLKNNPDFLNEILKTGRRIYG